MLVGGAYEFSWRLATRVNFHGGWRRILFFMAVGNVYDFMVVGNAYDFHGGWQRV